MDSHDWETPGRSGTPDPTAKVPRRWAGPAPSSSPAPDPEPKREYKKDPAWDKLLLLVGAAVVVLAILIVPGILNQGGQNPIAAAAEATRNSPGFRMNMQMSVQGPVPMTMTGTGVMNGATERALMEFKANAPAAGADFSMTEVVDNLDLYMRAPVITQELGGKQWLLIKAESFLGDLVQGSSGGVGAGMSASPAQQLEQLESDSDSVTVVGREQIGGAATTHYTAVVDLQHALDDLRNSSSELADLVEKTLDNTSGTETVNVWVDGQGLLRRMQSSLDMGAMGAWTMTADFSDYGIHPKIDVPAESEVYDATPMLEEILKNAG